jgi:hypothetical protein
MPGVSITLALIVALAIPLVDVHRSGVSRGHGAISAEVVASSGPSEIVERIAPSVVQVLSAPTGAANDSIGAGRGSGIAVEGGVISSDHVVGDADQVVVVASDGRRGSATVVRRAPARDLVLLETSLALQPVALEAASNQHAGALLLVLGYPRPDLLGDAGLTLTHGLVSAVRHDQEGITYLQTDAPMDPGVSGGAVVNMRGHLVGVPSSGLQSDLGSGLSFAVGSEEIGALLQPPPPTALPAREYVGDARDLLPGDADIGPPWKIAPVPPGASNTPADGAVTASVRMVSGDPLAMGSPFAELRPAVMLVRDTQHAQWVWQRAIRHPPAGFVRLPDPALDPTCRAYQRTGAEITDVQVLCQEANVVVGVALSGTPDLARPDVAVRAANLIKARIHGAGP